MVQSGTQLLTYANFGKETVRGTPVAPTRQMYFDGTGVFEEDDGLNFHQTENTGIRLRTRRVTQTSEDVALKLKTSAGVGYDDLVVPLSQLKGGVTAVGAGADKTWTFTPTWTGALNAPESYSVDTGDDIQNWRHQYAMAKSWKLSAALGELTQLEMEMFAQKAVKGAKAAPAAVQPVKIPGELWTLKTATTIAGLTGASVQLNELVAWDLTVDTGLQAEHYMDGTLNFGQHFETDIAAILNMTVESTAYSVSEFWDKAKAQTLDCVRLKVTGPTLGGSNYSVQIDMPVLWEVPKVQAADRDGVNLWTIQGHLAYDGANGIIPVVVNSMTALP